MTHKILSSLQENEILSQSQKNKEESVEAIMICDPFEIAGKVIEDFCGNKETCDLKIKDALYVDKKMSWSTWSNDFKRPFIDRYYTLHYQVWKKGNDQSKTKSNYEFPLKRDARSIRDRLAKTFPKGELQLLKWSNNIPLNDRLPKPSQKARVFQPLS